MTRYGAAPRHDSPGLCKDTLHALDRVAHLSLAMGDLNTAERQTRTALEHRGKMNQAPRPENEVRDPQPEFINALGDVLYQDVLLRERLTVQGG